MSPRPCLSLYLTHRFVRAGPMFLALAWIGAVPSASAQTGEPPLPSWFPAAAVDGATAQLAEGLAAVQRDATEKQIADAGKRGVRDLILRIDAWGLEGLTERAPSFPELDVPSVGDPIVDLVARYGVCSLGVYEELAASPREKFYVKLVEVSVGVLSSFLRSEALAAGATDDSLRAARRRTNGRHFLAGWSGTKSRGTM